MRGEKRRSWVKMWVTGWLHGSIRWQLDPAERGVWADLICLAGECSRDGEICDNDGRPFPRSYIANQLNIPQPLLDITIAKCRHEGRINDQDEIIVISNWKTYQSEYERQRPYRELKKYGQPTELSDEHTAAARELWGKALLELQDVVSKTNFTTWFSSVTPISYHDQCLEVAAPSQEVCHYLDTQQRSLIEKTLYRLAGCELKFLVSLIGETNISAD